MTYDEFKNVSKEAKRRLAAECLGWKYVEDESNGLVWHWFVKPDGKSMHKGAWTPDLSLDQVRLLELKAKEDEKVWEQYLKLRTKSLIYEDPEDNLEPMGDIILSNADEKLFCLFQAFGVEDKLKEER